MCFLVGCQTGAQKEATKQQAELTDTQNQIAKFGLRNAGGPINQAISGATGAQSWFSKLLSGDKTAIMSAVAPGIQTLTGEYDTLAKQAKNTLPSGGERNKLISELPFRKAGDIATLVGGAQEKGAQGMTTIAQLLGNLGTSLLSGSTSAAGTGGAIAGETVSQEQRQQQQQQQAGQGIGAFIALLAGI
jgi:hypothetical protein